MWQSIKNVWLDSVWSKVIASIIFAGLVALWGWWKGWFARLRKPVLRKTHAYPADQATTGATYPLKYYVELINDSQRCSAVRVIDFRENAIKLQKFVPNTLQLMLGGNWLPTPHTVDSVALLPHQRCRVWIGVDATKFTKADLERLEGKLGTLILAANSTEIRFDL